MISTKPFLLVSAVLIVALPAWVVSVSFMLGQPWLLIVLVPVCDIGYGDCPALTGLALAYYIFSESYYFLYIYMLCDIISFSTRVLTGNVDSNVHFS